MNSRELISKLTPLHGAGEARAIVRMVMEERFGLSHTDLLLGKDKNLLPDDRKELEKIALRLLSGEPVQYVLGFADFCGHRFIVTPDVLIPRPETEELTRFAIDEARLMNVNRQLVNILDLCTGSGCIAISLALAFPSAHIFAVDVSEAALDVARCNALALGTMNVEFSRHNILGDSFSSPQVDMIVSNPPYVRQSEAQEMTPTVLNHEPHLALFVTDSDPLRFYLAIAAIGHRHLRPGGAVLVEINATLAEESRQLFLSSGYTAVTLFNDQFNRPRILKARMKGID